MATVTEPQSRTNAPGIQVVPPPLNDGGSFDIDTHDTGSFDTDSIQALMHHEDEHDHSEHEPITFKYKIALLSMVIFPTLGMIIAILLAWQWGMMSWLDLGMLIGGWYLTGLGITIGFHRMLTHRAFETTEPIRAFWTTLGSLSMEGSPLDWCMVHRKHHRFSDHHGDPHSPSLEGDGLCNKIKGFWNSHMGWMFKANWDRKERSRYIPDLVNDPLLSSIDRNYGWWILATLLIPFFIGGLVTWSIQGAFLGLIWGGLARVCLSHHMTWSINSICHIIGRRHYQSSDDSRNNLFFGYFSHGEGWHNNHHAFPTSAKHGLKWYQFDLSWTIIRAMEICGLAWNVKLPTDRQMKAREL